MGVDELFSRIKISDKVKDNSYTQIRINYNKNDFLDGFLYSFRYLISM